MLAPTPLFDRPPFALTPTRDEEMVGNVLWANRGTGPIGVVRLCELIGGDERKVKGVIEALVVKHHLPIGGSRMYPYGYFVCVTPADFEEAVRPFHAQIRSMFKRLRVLMNSQQIAELLGQLRIEYGETNDELRPTPEQDQPVGGAARAA